MELKSKGNYYVTEGDKVISTLNWDNGVESEDVIILSKKEDVEVFTISCYNKKSKECVFLRENVRTYNITKYGIIVEVYTDLSAKETKWGVISFDGKIVIPFEFSRIEPCNKHNQFLYVTNEDTGIYDYDGRKILEEKYIAFFEYETCIVYRTRKSEHESSRNGIFFVKTGKIIEPKYFIIDVTDQCVMVNNLLKDSGAYSLDGDVLVKDRWRQIEFVEHKGKYFLRTYERIKGHMSNALYTLPEGKCMIPSKNAYISFFDYGIEVVYNKTQCSELLSYDGRKILPGMYNIINDLEHGKLLTRCGREYTIFTYEGKVIHSGKFEFVNTHKRPINYCQFVLCDLIGAFVYIPRFNMFMPGYEVRGSETGKVEYYDLANERWEELPEDEYNNAEEVKSLYDHVERA